MGEVGVYMSHCHWEEAEFKPRNPGFDASALGELGEESMCRLVEVGFDAPPQPHNLPLHLQLS